MTSNDPIAAILDQLAAHREQLARLTPARLDEHAAALAELTGTTLDGADPDGYQPEPAPQWWNLPADGRAEPIARLRAWVEQVYRPGYGHLAATLGPCWEAHDLCLYALDIAASLWSVLYLQPAADPGPAVRPGRIPGPHPARPGRPAPGRNPALPPPPRPRTGQHPAVEQAMTDATLRQALAFATRGWPVLPCLPGQKIPATAHGYRDATTDPGQITEWFGRHPDWNLAIATGAPGPDVLDVDDHGPAGNGYPAFRRLRAAGLLDGAAIYVRTPSGGLHAYFTGSQPAQRPPARPPPGLPLGRRLRPDPALPDRRPALPAHQANPAATAAWTGPPSPGCCNPSASPAPAARSPGRQPRPDRPGPLGRRPARRQPQRRPVLGRQPRPGNRPRRRPEPARRRRPPGRPRRRRDHPDPELRPPHHPPPARPPSRGQLT